MDQMKTKMNYSVDDGCSTPLFSADDISLQNVKIDGKEQSQWVALVQLDSQSKGGYLQNEVHRCNSLGYMPYNKVTVKVNMEQMTEKMCEKKHYYESKNILITGGGGSIGSEIVLQLVSTNFESLNILDHSEINIYKIKKQLDEYKELKNQQNKIRYYISSINNLSLLEKNFNKILELEFENIEMIKL